MDKLGKLGRLYLPFSIFPHVGHCFSQGYPRCDILGTSVINLVDAGLHVGDERNWLHQPLRQCHGKHEMIETMKDRVACLNVMGSNEWKIATDLRVTATIFLLDTISAFGTRRISGFTHQCFTTFQFVVG